MDATTFACSICGESSTQICVYCTQDACSNHLCERCHRCSDCCACEMKLDETERPAKNVYGYGHHNGHGHLIGTTFPPDALN
jgi:hypothetical protein